MKSLFDELPREVRAPFDEALLKALTHEVGYKRMAGRLLATEITQKTYDWTKAELEARCDPIDLIAACSLVQDAMLTAVMMMILDPRKIKNEAEGRELARGTAEAARHSLEKTFAKAIEERRQEALRAQEKEAI